MKQLIVSNILEHAARFHIESGVVTYEDNGESSFTSYKDVLQNSMVFAELLLNKEISTLDVVGTIAWNSCSHMELCYGVLQIGSIFHPINPRFSIENMTYTINHAEDKIVFYDKEFSNVVSTLQSLCTKVKFWLCLQDVLRISEHISHALLHHNFQETSGAVLCYTSGTTGFPKGVLYSHRTIVLCSLVTSLPDALRISMSDNIFSVVNFFHVSSWNTLFSAPLTGAKLIFWRGNIIKFESLWNVIQKENVTFSAAVPSFWSMMFRCRSLNKYFPNKLERVLIGGSPCPTAIVDKFTLHGIKVIYAWGMSEVCAMATSSYKFGTSVEDCNLACHRAGKPLFGINIKIEDENHQECPWDGMSMGRLLVEGHWVIESYFKDVKFQQDGWFVTGDIATIDRDRSLNIEDREKDIIKFAGEWISSVSVESVALEHPMVENCACVAQYHETWGEVPVLFVSFKEETEINELEVFLKSKLPSRSLPKEIIRITEFPTNASGKILKRELRK